MKREGEAGLLLSRGGEGRGFWTQNLVYQKWPDQIFPMVNFVFSHCGHFGVGRGGGGFGGGVPPPWFLIILKKPWGGGGLGSGACVRGRPQAFNKYRATNTDGKPNRNRTTVTQQHDRNLSFPTALVATRSINFIVLVCQNCHHCRVYTLLCTMLLTAIQGHQRIIDKHTKESQENTTQANHSATTTPTHITTTATILLPRFVGLVPAQHLGPYLPTRTGVNHSPNHL